MKTNNKTWLTPALRLVKKYAPNTYEAMINADWKVQVVKSEKDLITISGLLHPWNLMQLIDALNDALAVTIRSSCKDPDELEEWNRLLAKNHHGNGPVGGALNHTTWVNLRKLNGEAYHEGVDPVGLAALVLVHEWWHRRGYGERKAYDAGTEFAFKMGQPRIARLSEHTRVKAGVS